MYASDLAVTTASRRGLNRAREIQRYVYTGLLSSENHGENHRCAKRGGAGTRGQAAAGTSAKAGGAAGVSTRSVDGLSGARSLGPFLFLRALFFFHQYKIILVIPISRRVFLAVLAVLIWRRRYRSSRSYSCSQLSRHNNNMYISQTVTSLRALLHSTNFLPSGLRTTQLTRLREQTQIYNIYAAY
ncbi:unnamed protein product [Arctia plantaginis]|uniref:Uncharacterized protein n=1 Tax=Arctia plantaginis TaxID=874455 RepID=A0A8S1B371_ARCPL|nr:unnamed protein product [Arctia plantaginis]